MATVLVVGDDVDVLERLRASLRVDGHRIIRPSDVDPSEQLHRTRPDAVVLDLGAREHDPWRLLGSIKADRDPAVSTTPVVVVAVEASPEDRIRAAIEGAVACLTLVDEVRTALRDVLNGEPEPLRRRRMQRRALEELAQLEKGVEPVPGVGAARPRLTRLERAPERRGQTPRLREARQRAGQLSPKQRELLVVLNASSSVSEAAERLEVSRSNVYASLRRIGRKLGTRSVPELLALVRAGIVDGADLATDGRPEPPA